MKRLFWGPVLLVVGVLFVGPVAGAAGTYTWSVDGSVANSGLPAGLAPGIPLGPNVSSAKDGKTLEIAGSGKVTPSGHWIDGGGDYRILDKGGKVLKSGRWKPTSLTSYRDLGPEPEGSPVEQLRSAIIRAPITLQGLGTGRLLFLCGAHDKAGNELEGVNVVVGKLRFTHIDAGSTTVETF